MIDLSEDSKVWEHLALLALFITLLVIGPANIWDKDIARDHPYGFYAQDTYIFTSYQYYLQESGSWRQLAPYLARGYTDAIQSQPSVLEILSVLLAQATGFGFFTTTYLIVMVLAFLAVFAYYFLIRSFNPQVAVLSLPLNVLLFSPVFITAFTWGNWPFIAGSAMFVLFFWCLNKVKERWMPALGALALAAVAFGHTSEYIFAVPLLGGLLLVDAVSREFRWQTWKRIAGMVLGSVVLAGYYLVIFQGTFLQHAPLQFITPDVAGLGMFVKLTTPGVWLALVVGAGVVLGFLLVRRHRALQIGMVMLVLGFTHLIGTGKRGLETRYLWPIYLSVFFGLLIYVILTKLMKLRLSLRACALISIALTAFLAMQYQQPIDGPGLTTREAWQAIEWVAQQTPRNATVLYYYGDAYGQAGVLFNAQRLASAILIEDYIAMAQAGQLRRLVQTERISDRTNAYPYRKGLFTFGFHQIEDNVTVRGPEDLCTFDYHVLDKVSRAQGAGQFNLAIVQHLVQNANFTKAFENDGVIILKNPKPRGECLA